MLVRADTPQIVRQLIVFMEEKGETPLSVIDSIASFRESEATYVDEKGMNLLLLALLKGKGSIAEALLDTGFFDNRPDILFAYREGSTVICRAAQRGYVVVVKKLYELSVALISAINPAGQVNSAGYKIWFKPDDLGNTPLHYAAARKNLKLCLFLIDLIMQEPEEMRLQYLDRKNNNGDTPLHLAFDKIPSLFGRLFLASREQRVNGVIVHALLKAGADIDLINKADITPFDKLRQYNVSFQLEFLQFLTNREKQTETLSQETEQAEQEEKSLVKVPKKQSKIFLPINEDAEQLLRCYRQYLTFHRDDKLASVYARYMGKRSLTELVLSRLEFDKKFDVDKVAQNPLFIHIHLNDQVAMRLSSFSARFFAKTDLDDPAAHNLLVLLERDKIRVNRLIREMRIASNHWTQGAVNPLIWVFVGLTVLSGFALLCSGAQFRTLYTTASPEKFYFNGQEIMAADAQHHPNTTHLECQRDYKRTNNKTNDYYTYVAYQHDYRGVKEVSTFLGYCYPDNSLAWYMASMIEIIVLLPSILTSLVMTIRHCVCISQYIPQREWNHYYQSVEEIANKLNRLEMDELSEAKNNVKNLLFKNLDKLKDSDEKKEKVLDAFNNIISALKILEKDLFHSSQPFTKPPADLQSVKVEEAPSYVESEETGLLSDDSLATRDIALRGFI